MASRDVRGAKQGVGGHEIAPEELLEMLEGAPELIGVADLCCGHELYRNPAMRRVMGEPRPDIPLEQRIAQSHPEWAVRRILDEAIPAARRDGVWQGETTVRAVDGTEFAALQTIIVHADEHGEVQRCSTIIRDVTEQKATEHALRKSEERYRRFLEDFLGVAYQIDPDDYRVVLLRGAVEAITGYDRAYLLDHGYCWGDLIHADDWERVAAEDAAIRRRGERVGDLRYRIRHRDGSTRWVRDIWQMVELPANGRQVFQGALYDITERMELEQARAQADRDRTTFLAAVSHDLRTPLNAVVGFTGLLQDTELDAEQRRYVELCRTASQTLLGLVDTLLSLSRLEAGEMQLECAPFDLRAFLEDEVGLLEALAAEKGLSLSLHIDPAVPGWVEGDAVRFGQVLYNLANNAIKFTEQGSVVITVEPADGDGLLRVAVRDTGPGISEADQKRIFRAFTQGGDVFRRQEGSGLGLTICKELVRLMGGDLGLKSAPGAGSTFQFTARLPAVEPSAADGAEATVAVDRSHPQADRPLRVLVAEDEPTNALLIRTLLEQRGCQVTVVEDGQAAIDHCAAERPDLVLLDVQMPSVDGCQALGRIRQHESQIGAARTPVVMCTAHAVEQIWADCARQGSDYILTKPIDRDELSRVLAWVRQPAVDGH
ncbi:ATP-binding protein [Halorhodospira halophila]|uniref:histidine kinase n=1 Tax=Halorhodospira halophila (strain DSM 244 / SL1) TaxID=349124 RepID=A1WTW8_HALHL|nr:ATP-binding protein [Halorhodospira halophila]ABM61130.1 PAS/PAC sensor hybrid histidine kinase [Halorhodospira halophila SL1]MBK1729676.1 hybrid sensor histidine kinase/response regulator [Halorhodospira halophila]